MGGRRQRLTALLSPCSLPAPARSFVDENIANEDGGAIACLDCQEVYLFNTTANGAQRAFLRLPFPACLLPAPGGQPGLSRPCLCPAPAANYATRGGAVYAESGTTSPLVLLIYSTLSQNRATYKPLSGNLNQINQVRAPGLVALEWLEGTCTAAGDLSRQVCRHCTAP
jgi:predicted outer membrane repeat protein